jgi:hypothetical protein
VTIQGCSERRVSECFFQKTTQQVEVVELQTQSLLAFCGMCDEEDRLFAKFSVKSLERELATAVQDEATRVAVGLFSRRGDSYGPN